jgi:lysophospholipase L1-like esterase
MRFLHAEAATDRYRQRCFMKPSSLAQHLRRALGCLAAGIALCGWIMRTSAAPPPVRIMPVGDSITYGSPVPGGYRWPLYQLLTDAGYNAHFVGTQNGNATNGQTEVWHEGHGGWRIHEIDGIIAGVFGQIADPDVLLLLIGTNDFGTNYDVNNATNRLDALIGKITALRPYCKLIVANLTVRGEPYNTNIQTNFNNSVPGIVAKHAALGEQVYFTDLYSAVPLSDFPDQLHPGSAGYQKMATNWFQALTNVISPLGTTNAPAVSRATALTGLTNVLVTFSKPVADSATNLSHFAISGGLTLLGASLDPATARDLTLTTTPQAPLSLYTLTVSNVVDRTPAATPMAAPASVPLQTATTGLVGRGVFENVPEASEYSLVYSIDLPNSPSYGTVPYNIDLRSWHSNFTRVAYYLELQSSNAPVNFAWVSFDAVTNNVNAIGVPNVASGAIFQQPLTNMNVLSSSTNVLIGAGLGGGNIEFWPSNYTQSNIAAVAGASHTAYDWGDNATAGTYGSMQIHNHDAGQVIFAFNRWGGTAGPADLGIGNRPGSADVDWTFAQNAATYVVKTLQVLVLPASSTNAPTLLGAAAGSGWTSVTLRFSEPLDDSATNTSLYGLSGGLTVLSATLDPLTKLSVTLDTTPQAVATAYTVTVSGVSGRTAAHNVIAAGSAAAFRSPAVSGVYNNVPKAAGYTMVYSLPIPNAPSYGIAGTPYAADNHIGLGPFTRVAYYLELQTNGGPVQFVWAEMDPFTPDAGRIGVPSLASGALFQQNVTNLTVYSSALNVTEGENLSGCNIEFWPWNYAQSNAAHVANAGDTAFDWGDQISLGTGNYGSMQIHNHDAGQVLLAFNRWGGAGGNADLGIGNRPGSADMDWTFAQNAATYAVKTLQVFVLPEPDTTPPTLVSADVTPDRTHVIVTFSEPLADGAANVGNFAIDDGILVLSAFPGSDLRQVTLTVSPLAGAAAYTLTVNNVRDRSAGANRIAPDSTIALAEEGLPPQIVARVPEAADYKLLYHLDVPVYSPGWNTSGTVYNIDRRTTAAPFSRVAYYLELGTSGGATNWVYVSADAFTPDPGKLGVPDMPSGALFQQRLTNMNVYSSQTNIVAGTGLSGGNIEFWPWNYAAANAAGVPNASGSTYDWGDQIGYIYGTASHASMQIHNSAASNVLFAYNAWGAARLSELGIGNQPTNQPDWTFATNAADYAFRRLYVLVQPSAGTNGPALLRALGVQGRTNVLVTFDRAVSEASANPVNFLIDGGDIAVTAAAVQTNLHDILLTTDPQTAGATYSLVVNDVRDRTTNGYSIVADATVNFASFADPPVFARVPESTNYTLVYRHALPAAVPNYNVNGIAYDFDQRPLISRPFSRVAYCVELATNAAGPTNWVYISDDSFTPDLNRIGVPVLGTGAGFQQRLATNANVYSSDTNIVTGTNLATCNIEFWPFNYGAATTATVPTGSGSQYDWNDTVDTGGQYACMQIHNYGALVGGGVSTGQVLFAFNRWGSQSGDADLGIGSQPTANPDWTFATNAATYAIRNLYVLVLLTNAPAPAAVAPAIVIQPTSRIVQLNGGASLGALATGTAPSYQWRRDGSPLSGETNAWLDIEGAQLSDAGAYDVTASNSAGVATSLVAVLAVNRPPVAGQDRIGAIQNAAVAVDVSRLLGNDSDPDGDAFAIGSLGPASANAGTATLAGATVTYDPPAGFLGEDSFAYVLADSRGGAATSAVFVTVMTNHSPVVLGSPSVVAGGYFRVSYAGVSNGTYTIRYVNDLIPGYWQILTNVVAAPSGFFQFEDRSAPLPPQRFYNAAPP